MFHMTTDGPLISTQDFLSMSNKEVETYGFKQSLDGLQ